MFSLRQPREGNIVERIMLHSKCNSLKKLAKLFGLAHGSIFKWQHKYIPEQWALPIEEKTKGKVKAMEVLVDSRRRRELWKEWKREQVREARERFKLK